MYIAEIMKKMGVIC